MPIRKRVAAAPRPAQPDPHDVWTWGSGDGCRPFHGWPGYRTQQAAAQAWDRIGRVVVWRDTPVGRVPAASERYDDLFNEALDTAIHVNVCELYPATAAASVRGAIERDRARVEAFRVARPKSYRQIEAFLQAFLATLDQIEADTRAFVGRPSAERFRMDRSPSRFGNTTYGSTEHTHDDDGQAIAGRRGR